MAYSIDLRQRVLDAYLAGEGSQRALAKRFKVSRGFIQNLLGLYQETGSIHPRAHGGGAAAKLDDETLPVVADLIKTQPDATLEELCADLKAKLAAPSGFHTFDAFADALFEENPGLTKKALVAHLTRHNLEAGNGTAAKTTMLKRLYTHHGGPAL